MSDASESRDAIGLEHMLFSPRGRIPRVDAIFAWVCVAIIASVLAGLWLGFAGTYYRQDVAALLSPWVWTPVAVIAVVLLWMTIGIFAKRCHDRDRSAWFLLVGLIPLVQLWPLVELLFFRGSRDLNHYGPVPKGMLDRWRVENADM